MAFGPVATALASTTVTAGGTGPAIALDDGNSLSVELDVTAVAGTSPSLTVSVQWSQDGSNWAGADPADSFTALTAAAVVVKAFTVKAPQCRLSWAVAGTTPSFDLAATAWVTN